MVPAEPTTALAHYATGDSLVGLAPPTVYFQTHVDYLDSATFVIHEETSMTERTKDQVSKILAEQPVGEELPAEVLSNIAGAFGSDSMTLGGDGYDMNNSNTGGDGAYDKTWGKQL